MLFLLNEMALNNRSVEFEYLHKKKDKLEPAYFSRSLEHIWPMSKVYFKKKNIDDDYAVSEKSKETIVGKKKDGYLYLNPYLQKLLVHLTRTLFICERIKRKLNEISITLIIG